jgi:hypothetical protein
MSGNPELVEQLRIFAMLAQFRLQYNKGICRNRSPTGPKVPISLGSIPSNWRLPLYYIEADPQPKVPHDGIHIGEITGWRCWIWREANQRLCSMTTNSLWLEAMMTGNVEYSGEGVHAWKTEQQARAYLRQNLNLVRWGSARRPDALVLGSVKMWGEVAEHSDGWRSDCARVHELKAAIVLGEPDAALLQRIRQIYERQ